MEQDSNNLWDMGQNMNDRTKKSTIWPVYRYIYYLLRFLHSKLLVEWARAKFKIDQGKYTPSVDNPKIHGFYHCYDWVNLESTMPVCLSACLPVLIWILFAWFLAKLFLQTSAPSILLRLSFFSFTSYFILPFSLPSFFLSILSSSFSSLLFVPSWWNSAVSDSSSS